MEKWPILDQNHGLTPLNKTQFFDFFNFLFLQLKKEFFAGEYHKTHFPGLDCLKKEDKKMANIGPKPWTNLFGKNSIFQLSQHLVFIAQKGVLSLQNTIKHIFLAYITLKKEDGKMANFGQKPWTNPFGKNSIFRLFQLLVFIA